jgi:hypothetical protein
VALARKGRVVTPTPERTLGPFVSENPTAGLTGTGRPAPPERHEMTSTPTRRRARGCVERGSGEILKSLFVNQAVLLPV